MSTKLYKNVFINSSIYDIFLSLHKLERKNMKTDKNSFKQLWIVCSLFITYLLLGSFIVNRSFFDIVYLVFFWILNIFGIN